LKLLSRSIPFLVILLFGAATGARAQSVSVDLGFGTAADTSNGQCISTFGETSGTCFSPSAGAFGATSSKMTGLFGTFGANFMLNSKLGVGGEYSFRWSQGSYGDVNYRPAFYDFNAIYHPMGGEKKIVPEIEGGLGGVDLKFYAPTECDALTCSSGSQNYLESSNHFQLHAAAGVLIYVRGGIFIRPQVDLHWVDNFYQFGSGFVPEGTIAVGYTFGGR
jgi:hypothetical protein